MTDNLNIEAYLERIGFQSRILLSEEILHGLHKAHTLSIPFENLDVFFGRPIALDLPTLFGKLVTGNRGGYCFEMNGLFSAVLGKIGFEVVPLLARVAFDFNRQFGPKTHQVLMVKTGSSRWLVDVGFGKDGIISPLLLDTTDDQHQFGRIYRIEPHPQFGYILDLRTPDRDFCQYAFTLDKCWPADFVMANHFTATYPESLFVKTLVCTMPTEQGRVTLTDRHLKIVSNSIVRQTEIRDLGDFGAKLSAHFKLDLKKIQNKYRLG